MTRQVLKLLWVVLTLCTYSQEGMSLVITSIRNPVLTTYELGMHQYIQKWLQHMKQQRKNQAWTSLKTHFQRKQGDLIIYEGNSIIGRHWLYIELILQIRKKQVLLLVLKNSKARMKTTIVKKRKVDAQILLIGDKLRYEYLKTTLMNGPKRSTRQWRITASNQHNAGTKIKRGRLPYTCVFHPNNILLSFSICSKCTTILEYFLLMLVLGAM